MPKEKELVAIDYGRSGNIIEDLSKVKIPDDIKRSLQETLRRIANE